jgi:myosin-crossreactive antigen
MPKRKCVLIEKLRTKYPFIIPCNCDGKVDEKLKCTQCNAIFSIQHDSRSDIMQHIATKRPKLAENASVNSKATDYFSKNQWMKWKEIFQLMKLCLRIMYACTTRVSVRWTARRK